MPIELSAVYWPYVGVLSLIAFVAALLGNLISFRNRFAAAIIAAILFAAGFIFWTYYPHDSLPSPLSSWPTSPSSSAVSSPSPSSPSPSPATPNPQ